MSVTHEHEKAAIVGVGHVGSAMHQLIPDAVLYDPIRAIGCRGAVNRTQFAFICVPTPSASDGSCDTSAVEEVIAWLETPFIVIRSMKKKMICWVLLCLAPRGASGLKYIRKSVLPAQRSLAPRGASGLK